MAAETAQGPLVFACPQYEPLCFTVDGVPGGHIVELIRRMTSLQSKIAPSYVILPARRFYKGFVSMPAAFSILARNPSIYPDLIFGEVPIFFGELRLYSLAKTENFSGFDNLVNKRIGLRRGMTYNGKREKLDSLGDQITLLKVNRGNNLFRLLEMARVDYVLDYWFPGGKSVPKGYSSLTLERVEFYFAVPSRLENAKSILDQLDILYGQELLKQGQKPLLPSQVGF